MSYESTFNANRSLSRAGSAGTYKRATDGYANGGFSVTFYHTPSGKSVYFKAFITAYNETYKSEWAEQQVMGRADGLHIFTGNTRSISMALVVPAATESEGVQNLSKVQNLIQFLYPSYHDSSNALTLNQSPLIRLRVMNLLTKCDAIQEYEDIFGAHATGLAVDPKKGALGLIKNLTINHNLENADAGVLELGGGSRIVPKLIELNFDFQVIHERVLGWDDHMEYRAPPRSDDSGQGALGPIDDFMALDTSTGGALGPINQFAGSDGGQYFRTVAFGVASEGNASNYPYQLKSDSIVSPAQIQMPRSSDSRPPPSGDPAPSPDPDNPDAIFDDALPGLNDELLSSSDTSDEAQRSNALADASAVIVNSNAAIDSNADGSESGFNPFDNVDPSASIEENVFAGERGGDTYEWLSEDVI